MESNLEAVIYAAVRRAITSRSLGPGMPISENELSRHFGASRTPVRAALRRLAQDRLVEIVPKRGTFVVKPTVADVDHAWAVRIALETLSVREATPRIVREEVEALVGLTFEEERALHGRDFATMLECGNTIHERIACATGNAWLMEALGRVIAYCSIHYAFYEPVDWSRPTSSVEHRAILAAVAQRDAARAVELMEAHLKRQRAMFNLNGTLWPEAPPWHLAASRVSDSSSDDSQEG